MMIRKKIKLKTPIYSERKEVFEALGYKEVAYIEKNKKACVTLEIDENSPHYHELRKFEKTLYPSGPVFYPILLLVAISFTLLTVFVILFTTQRQNFDLVTNALSFLIPSGIFLLASMIYSYIYYKLNMRIILKGHPNKESILKAIEAIKSK